MVAAAAVLGVHLMDRRANVIRVGTLTRNAERTTAFVPEETYVQDDARPILTLAWHVPGDPDQTRARLVDRGDKLGLYGQLPPWFQGLLPEGALRDLVDAEMGPGEHDNFDVLVRLGADLPGGVLVIPDNPDAPPTVGPIRWEHVAGFNAPLPQGTVKFSLAGVQLKFAAEAQGERLTVPASSGEARLILKLASDRYEGLPEAEYAAMTLAKAAGVNTAPCWLARTKDIHGLPGEFLKGPTALVVERFDRLADGGRIHMEDAGQILTAWGDQKYTKANTETVLNMIRRFSTDWRGDIMEGLRRVVVDVLVGNGDNHLKNWSFVFPRPGEIRLSPAYDIVPTVFFHEHDELALRFAGKSKAFEKITLKRFNKAAQFLRLDPRQVEDAVVGTIRTAIADWPSMLEGLPISDQRKKWFLERLFSLPLVREVSTI